MKALSLRAVPFDDLIDEIRRRCRKQASRAVLRVGDALSVDVAGLRVRWGALDAVLRPRECDVLVALVGAHPIGLTPVQLAEVVWGAEADPVNARVYVRTLRRKLPGLVGSGGQGVQARYRLAAAARRTGEGEAAG